MFTKKLASFGKKTLCGIGTATARVGKFAVEVLYEQRVNTVLNTGYYNLKKENAVNGLIYACCDALDPDHVNPTDAAISSLEMIESIAQKVRNNPGMFR